MGQPRKNNPNYRRTTTTVTRGPNRGRKTTTYKRVIKPGFVLPPPEMRVTVFGVPSPAKSNAVSRWTWRRAVARARAAWYESMGVKPEPKSAKAPLPRSTEERDLIRERLRARMIADGFDPETGYNALGFDMWGGHRDIKQTPGKPLVNLYTGKEWSPTGFREDGTHVETDTLYDPDGVSEEGWTEDGICVFTGTVFGLNDKTRDGEDEATYWANHVEWRTPEVEAEIAETKRQQAEAKARIDEMVALERKVERLGLAA